MRRTLSSGFTVMELLVSLAVLAILAALLFPVFRSSLIAARKSACIQNMHQIGGAFQNYLVDYDDHFPPVAYRGDIPGDSTDNRTWVQNLLPYVGTLSLFMCPGDTARDNGAKRPRSMGSNPDPGQELFESSIRTDFGYNYMYLSPLLLDSNGRWESVSRKTSEVRDQSSTIALVDSVWNRDRSGAPYGGGSFIVVPPCRYAGTPSSYSDTFELPFDAKYYFGPNPVGWHDPVSKDWLAYGGAWPWHAGKFNVLFVGGNAKTMVVADLTFGCNFQPNWRGLIHSREDYKWDME